MIHKAKKNWKENLFFNTNENGFSTNFPQTIKEDGF
jgi:hypothetical protein